MKLKPTRRSVGWTAAVLTSLAAASLSAQTAPACQPNNRRALSRVRIFVLRFSPHVVSPAFSVATESVIVLIWPR